MKKFLALLTLAALTSKITGKDLDDLVWEDLLVLFADEEWVEKFEAVYNLF